MPWLQSANDDLLPIGEWLEPTELRDLLSSTLLRYTHLAARVMPTNSSRSREDPDRSLNEVSTRNRVRASAHPACRALIFAVVLCPGSSAAETTLPP